MKVDLVYHVLSGIHAVSSSDIYLIREHEMTDAQEDDSVLGYLIEQVSLDKNRVRVWLQPDKEFYRSPPDSDWTKNWAETKEYQDHVAGLISQGWRIWNSGAEPTP